MALYKTAACEELDGVTVELKKRDRCTPHGGAGAPCEEILIIRPSSIVNQNTSLARYVAFHRTFVRHRATKKDWCHTFSLVYDMRTIPLPANAATLIERIVDVVQLHNDCGDDYLRLLHASVIVVRDAKCARFIDLCFRLLGGLPERPVITFVDATVVRDDAGEHGNEDGRSIDHGGERLDDHLNDESRELIRLLKRAPAPPLAASRT